jgi:hypothetical protein
MNEFFLQYLDTVLAYVPGVAERSAIGLSTASPLARSGASSYTCRTDS